MKTLQKLYFALKLLGVAAVYTALAQLALAFFSLAGIIGTFWPASGWSLAVLLLGGPRLAWGVFAGALVSELMLGLALPAAVLIAGGATLGALLGHWLLRRDARFNPDLDNLGDYVRLVIWAAIPASALSALIGVGSITAAGSLSSSELGRNMVQWMIGDALGILLVTSLLLIWRQAPDQLRDRRRWAEAALLMGLTLLAGEIVLQGWLSQELSTFVPKGYWLLPMAFWAAARLGPHGAIFILCTISVQAMQGIHANTGFMANPDVETRLVDGWFFVTLSWLMIMFLAVHIKGYRRAESDLRIAATAFECQEGMIITDAQMRILRTNHSFTRIMGYSNEEVIGQTTTFMRSNRHPASFYENAWRTAQEHGVWSHEVWHQRKNGEVFPQWLTCTAVKDEHGVITNYVVTHTDITSQKQQEAKRLADETAHRDALVREVHHRIKNNLQGISGLLRLFAQDNPQTTEAINQVMSQIRSIAVLHGLQGRTSMDTVRLCELTSAIAADVQSVWQTPVAVDIPALWTPGIIAEKEAVPIALVLNELLVNAVKHGGKAHGHVSVTLRKGEDPETIQVAIRNAGHLRANTDRPAAHHAGLQLIASLMPREGARLTREQRENEVLTQLEISPPVLHMEENPA
ncbi:MAG: MASE1 domain-containing protein [Burkholderiales bacterium]|nr:MASE1 domain-containing protein [Burkholderiales bacterium]